MLDTTICTEINNRFKRILHFFDQNVVPNIANGTSPQVYFMFIHAFSIFTYTCTYGSEIWTRPGLNLVW